MKLELKHLAPYLPYGLKYKKENNDVTIFELIGLSERNRNTKGEWRTYNRHQFSSNPIDAIPIRPILKPLSDLNPKSEKIFDSNTKDMEILKHNNPSYSNLMVMQLIKMKGLMYEDFEFLLSKHYDVFGLIEKGLAIDINKL